MRFKNRYKKLFFSILTSIIASVTLIKIQAQIIGKGQAHFSTKWMQIDSPKYQLIFPSSFTSEATSLAKKLDLFISKTSQDLKINPKKISIIINNEHLEQNGFVQLAPRKSEVYPVPSATSTNEEWFENLIIHELRHVAQIDKLSGKFTKPFFEELGLALFGLHLPSWFFEGDAVEMETLLTAGGRGRTPSWEMPIRALLSEQIEYDFNKYLMGSYKDIVPSFYTIGYLMTSTLTNEKGLHVKEKIINDMRKNLLRPYNFNKSLKKYYGKNTDKLFQKTILNLQKHWGDHNKFPATKSNFIHFETKDNKYYTSYYHPQTNSNNDIYSIRSSPQKRNQIIKHNGLIESVIVELGLQLTPYFHIRDHLIVWDEYHKHPRYEKNTYSDIQLYDINKRKTYKITNNTRYYSPHLHPFLHQVTAVRVDKDNRSFLIHLDLETGEEVNNAFHIPGLHIQQPAYNTSGNKIVFIGISDLGTNLFELDVETEIAHPLLPWANQQLEKPQYFNNDIIFKAHYQGKDQIYSLQNGDIYQLTESTYGAFTPNICDSILTFSDYQTHGYKIAQLNLNNHKYSSKVKIHKNTTYFSVDKESVIDKSKFSLDAIDTVSIKRYRPLRNFFNFHSLSLSSNNFEDFDNFKPGIFWYANDLLNTSQIKLGYEYDMDTRKSNYSAEFTYQKFPPKLSLKYKNKGQISAATLTNDSDKKTIQIDWREHQYIIDIQLPFTVYKRSYSQSYGFNMGTSYTKRYNLSVTNIQNFKDVIAFPMHYQIYYNHNKMLSKMDLAPKWGQNVSITYRHLPFGNLPKSRLLSIRSGIYTPGILLNHSFRLRFSTQYANGIYSFSNDIPLPSGFEFLPNNKVRNTLLSEYKLPLIYPDWGIGKIAYVKRIYGQLFCDYLNINKTRFRPASYGAALYSNVHFFRYPMPAFTLGAKIAKLNLPNSTKQYATFYSLSYTY